MKELKLRLILLVIGVFLVGSSYFLSGEWRNEPTEDGFGFYSGEPVFEFDVREGTCENGYCNMAISSNIVLGLIGVMIGMGSIVPIRLTDEVRK